MMHPSDEAISAWLDGVADEATTQAIETALADDTAFAEHVAALAAADELVRAAYPVEPQVPDALLLRLGLAAPAAAADNAAATADVIDFAAARTRVRQAPPPAPRFAPGQLPRIAAQLALVAGLTGLATGWWLMAPATDAPYHALGSAAAEASANGIVMFDSAISTTAARALLIAAGATPVSDPSTAGAWRVAVAPAQRDAVLAQLRARPDVTMAAPIDRAG